MDKSLTRTFAEAAAAGSFALFVVAQLTGGNMHNHEHRTNEQIIQSLEAEIANLTECLPFAEGQQYYRDRNRIRELHERIAAIKAGSHEKAID